jgi:hypothetical protein
MSQFNFEILYHPSMAGSKLDTLTHGSGDLPTVGDNRSLKNQTIVITPENILHVSVTAILIPASPTPVQLLTDGYLDDPF